MDNKRAQRTKQKCGKFRILIIGRANAGKTTILKRVCDTTEEPEVYNKRGGKIDRSILAASAGRGEHDIENEMAFASNPDFCFHDSRGFESGGIDELDKVNAFITQRSQDRKLENRLHAIWYCIPMDDDRPFTAAETHFFSNIGTGCVPVIVVFTKFDALDDKAYDTLRKNNLSRSDARKEAPKHAVIEFEQRHLNSFYTKPYPPKRHVYLRDMNKEGTDCNELVRQTAGALDNEFLENLLVSTQRNNLELCIEYSFKRVVLPAMAEIVNKNSLLLFFQGTLTEKEITRKVVKMCAWFPQFFFDSLDFFDDSLDDSFSDDLLSDDLDLSLRSLREHIKLIYKEINGIIKQKPQIEQIILLGMAVVISAQKSIFRRDLKPSDAFVAVLQQYSVSPQRQTVALAVKEISIAMPPRLHEDTRDEWEETLQALLDIARNNFLDPQ